MNDKSEKVIDKVQSESAIYYTLAHLLFVANIEYKNISIVELVSGKWCKINLDGYIISFSLLDDISLKCLLIGQFSLKNIATQDDKGTIPIALFANNEFAVIEDDILVVNAEILSLSFIMLSRYEEVICSNRDKLDRFPFEESLACKYDFVEYPIVDEYALILRGKLETFLPEKMIRDISKSTVIIPSHDIDSVRRFKSIKSIFKTLASDLVVDKSVKTFGRSILAMFKSIFNPYRDPYIEAINILLSTSEKFGLKSEFYFMSAEKSSYNDGYSILLPAVQKIIKEIQEKDMIIGIHGGFETYRNGELLGQEIAGLKEVTVNEVKYARQHYLRLDVKETFQILEQLNVKFDSSLGFAEREGFRCGTCHMYSPYNFETNRCYTFKEIPLIAMDTTLFGYRKLSNDQAYNSISKLYSRCLAVNGDFTILWHNNSVVRERSRFNEVYMKFLTNNTNSREVSKVNYSK